MRYVVSMAYDVRALANFVLDLAAKDGRSLTNMQINKVVYFLHVDFLVEFARPLVSAKIEAWEHGPVFRELYAQFKRHGDTGIASQAVAVNPETGQAAKVVYSLQIDEESFLTPLARRYSSMSAAVLRAQSHVVGGPWDRVWNHDTTTNATMRITDDAILDWYGRSAKH